MTDWVYTSATAATAAGTLVLAVATYYSVRSAQRATRATELALLASIRPLVVASRLEDARQKVGFMDERWLLLEGGHAAIEVTDDAIYMALALRNAGNGLAVLDRWELYPDRQDGDSTPHEISVFRRLTRDIYVPASDIGFWQGALRDPQEPIFNQVKAAVAERRPMTLDVLYGDHEGGQHSITRFAIRPGREEQWLATVARHWSLDRPNPR